MPTAVVDRPHSPVTGTFATDTSVSKMPVTDTYVRSATSTRPVLDASAGRQSTDTARPMAEPGRPACAERPELFLDPSLEAEPTASAPARVRRQYTALAAEATEVCATCPLLAACLYRAVVDYDVAGFVAGTTERQRLAIRARLGVEVEPEDFDTLAGVVGGQRTVDHEEVVRLRRAHPDESLERLARRLGCSLSTVKRHLRRERNQPTTTKSPAPARPTSAQVRRATAEILAEISGSRRVAA